VALNDGLLAIKCRFVSTTKIIKNVCYLHPNTVKQYNHTLMRLCWCVLFLHNVYNMLC